MPNRLAVALLFVVSSGCTLTASPPTPIRVGIAVSLEDLAFPTARLFVLIPVAAIGGAADCLAGVYLKVAGSLPLSCAVEAGLTLGVSVNPVWGMLLEAHLETGYRHTFAGAEVWERTEDRGFAPTRDRGIPSGVTAIRAAAGWDFSGSGLPVTLLAECALGAEYPFNGAVLFHPEGGVCARLRLR